MSYLWQTLALCAGATLALSGCQATGGDSLSSGAPGPVAEISVAPVPDFVPEFIEGGSAADNKGFVDYVVGSALEVPENKRAGLAVVEALRDAGFASADLELTRDTSLIQLPVDSITVAVRFGDACVISQWGSDWYVSQVEPILVTEKCLVGETVSLD